MNGTPVMLLAWMLGALAIAHASQSLPGGARSAMAGAAIGIAAAGLFVIFRLGALS